MANTPTTPASVASLLDDEYIEALANKEAKAGYWETAAVLRDYVRIRGENAQLKARLESVVKMLEEKERATSCSDCGRYNGYPCADHGECGLFKRHEEFAAILRAARGEGGAE